MKVKCSTKKALKIRLWKESGLTDVCIVDFVGAEVAAAQRHSPKDSPLCLGLQPCSLRCSFHDSGRKYSNFSTEYLFTIYCAILDWCIKVCPVPGFEQSASHPPVSSRPFP